MTSSLSFSAGTDRLLEAIRPYSKDGSTAFPVAIKAETPKRRPDEDVRDWFVRLVDACAEGDPRACAIEENIGVFARLHWGGKSTLTYANIQVIVAECDLESLYLGETARTQYLRLDFDEETLGTPFSHPLPHLHVSGSTTRFALDGGNSENVVVDFLEFIYRHHVPRSWRRWAERTWNEHFAKTAREESENPFPRVMEAFDSNQCSELRDMARDVQVIKNVLRGHKDKLFGLKVSGPDRELLEYPSASRDERFGK
jgi:hypothetical protein